MPNTSNSMPTHLRHPEEPGANHQIRSLVLSVDLVGSRQIWPAHVGRVVDLVGSRRVPSDRLDDQTDDQAKQPPQAATSLAPAFSHQPAWIAGSQRST
jgi:hypothetical protein